jgi:POT family proton-dependent oligopeptide transporter
MSNNNEDFFKTNVLGHPADFVLFFTEMGTFFLLWNACFTSAFFNLYLSKRGWAWSVEDALSLYGTYTMAVYFTPVIEVY